MLEDGVRCGELSSRPDFSMFVLFINDAERRYLRIRRGQRFTSFSVEWHVVRIRCSEVGRCEADGGYGIFSS